MNIKSIIVLLLVSGSVQAAPKEFETENLLCGFDQGISCVSKASIEKDKAELELIKLQIEALKKAKSK